MTASVVLLLLGGSGPAPVASARLLAPWVLPPWVGRDRGLFVVELARAAGAESDRLALQLQRIKRQAYIPSMDFAAPRWERQLGIAVRPDLGLRARRRRALARRRGVQGALGDYLRGLVQEAVAGSALPTAYAAGGLWYVLKLADRGWPGDAAFQESERLLYESGPAAFGNFTAPWDTVNGLTWAQLDQMQWEALDVLTWTEIDGGA